VAARRGGGGGGGGGGGLLSSWLDPDAVQLHGYTGERDKASL
jgi:hypothetical protein